MISRYHVKAGTGLRRQMSGQGASHLHDHAGMVGELPRWDLDEAMERGLIVEQNTLGAVQSDSCDAVGAVSGSGARGVCAAVG